MLKGCMGKMKCKEPRFNSGHVTDAVKGDLLVWDSFGKSSSNCYLSRSGFGLLPQLLCIQ